MYSTCTGKRGSYFCFKLKFIAGDLYNIFFGRKNFIYNQRNVNSNLIGYVKKKQQQIGEKETKKGIKKSTKCLH